MALFSPPRRATRSTRGPLASSVADLPSVLRKMKRLLRGKGLSTDAALLRPLLLYPERAVDEEPLRGALFYALFHDQKTSDMLPDDIQEAARKLTLLPDPDNLATAAEQCAFKDPDEWVGLERARYIALRMAEMRRRVRPPAEAVPFIEGHLSTMAEYCQSDTGQKNARATFLMTQVPW